MIKESTVFVYVLFGCGYYGTGTGYFVCVCVVCMCVAHCSAAITILVRVTCVLVLWDNTLYFYTDMGYVLNLLITR